MPGLYPPPVETLPLEQVLTLLGLLIILSAFLFRLTTSSTAFTTSPKMRFVSFLLFYACIFDLLPPLDPPQAAREPIGVRLALSFLSMMMGWPSSILIFWPM